MKNTEKRVKVYLNNKMLRIYNYCVGEQDTLGKMLVEYLDIQYAYKYLIQQNENGDELNNITKNKENLTEDSLKFDYRRKRKILSRIFEDLEYEYGHLLKIIKTNDSSDNSDIDKSYSLENQPRFQTEEQQQKNEDYDSEEEYEENSKAERGGIEPDPSNPGCSTDGNLIW